MAVWTFSYEQTQCHLLSHLTGLTMSLYPLSSSPSLSFLIHPESALEAFAFLNVDLNKVRTLTLVDMSLLV